MIRRGMRSVFISSSPPKNSGRQDLAPGIPEKTGTGCYGISGPVPYAVLDKNIIL